MKKWTLEEHTKLIGYIEQATGSDSPPMTGDEIAVICGDNLNIILGRTLKPKTWANRIRIARADIAKQERIDAVIDEPIQKATPEMKGKTVVCLSKKAPDLDITVGKKYVIEESSYRRIDITNDTGNAHSFTHDYLPQFALCEPPEAPIPYTVVCRDCDEKDAEIEDLRKNIQGKHDYICKMQRRECDCESKDSEIASLETLLSELKRQLERMNRVSSIDTMNILELKDRSELAEARLEFALSDDYAWLSSVIDSGQHDKEKIAKLRRMVMMMDPMGER